VTDTDLDLDELDAFAAALPDDGHRAIAEQLATIARTHAARIDTLAEQLQALADRPIPITGDLPPVPPAS